MLGHGFGATEALGIPALVLAIVAAGALLATALVVDRHARRASEAGTGPADTSRDGAATVSPVPEPSALAAATAPSAVALALQVLGALLLIALVAVALLGDPLGNPAPRLLFVVAWMGLIPLALLVGPAWRPLNPLRLLPAARPRGGRGRDASGRAASGQAALWPAVAALLVFTWVEAVYPGLDEPATVLAVVAAGLVAGIAGTLVEGRGWLGRADLFEVYGGVVGDLAPLGVRQGAPARRRPVRALASAPVRAGLLGVLAVVVGNHLYHLLGDTTWWPALRPAWTGTGAVIGDTVVYAVVVAVTYGLLRVGAWPRERFAAALVPLAVGYAALHQLPVLLEEGPVALQQTADALGFDGGRVLVALTDLVPPTAVAALQVGGFIAAHVLAVVVAAAIARRTLGLRAAAGQGAVRALLVASVLAGLAL